LPDGEWSEMPPRKPDLPAALRKRADIPDVLRFKVSVDWTMPVLRDHLPKLEAIFRFYNLDSGKLPWEKLCWRLLEDFVPGFQFKRRAQGRPSRWSAEADIALVAEIDRLKKTGFTIREVCEILARKQPYRNFGSKVAQPAWSTLEGRYKKARKKLKAAAAERAKAGNK
jgi:hypothetical protein